MTAGGPPLRSFAFHYSVWTVVNVKRLALLAPKNVFAGTGGLFGGGIQLCNAFQLAAAIRIFGIVRGDIAHRLAWRYGLHSSFSFAEIITGG